MLGNGKRKAPGGLVEKEIKVCDCVIVLDPSLPNVLSIANVKLDVSIL